ncbi:sensor histidine kinase [Paenibacillus thalictri]|uniref:HAMP domain-containing protein n=1 Tax=Paenibacillus thalictri TaxID=2527873 RepID=A0A4Q9DSL2_9BACL|nr:histidine kinase [Paenibacillus thalictri]TBL77322.1 HAMP domain-containing protein [Paenibacillus thalictri]
MNLISKTLILIAMLLIPVIALYMYSNEQSIAVIEDQINTANQDRLARFLNEIESTLNQVSNYSNIITKDPDFAKLARNASSIDRYDYSVLSETAEWKLGLFSLSTDWMSRINLYFPATGRAVSSHSTVVYDENYLQQHLNPHWTFRNVTINGIDKRTFTRYFVEPYTGISNLRDASIIVEFDLMEDNIVRLLDQFKSKGNNDPFLYKAPDQYVLNHSSDERMARRIIASYDIAANSATKNHDVIRLDDKKVLIYFLGSANLGWTLIDYVPLEDIVAPMTKSRYLFYATVPLLLLLGIGAAIILYTHVQVPVNMLMENVSKLTQGNFSTRITSKANQEFAPLIGQFNEMAARIQHLVEKVYLEEIRAKEAIMKQLQSQINPHFLYNCLAYIVSMAKLNRPQPIVPMAYSLADYFKYTTRNVAMMTTVREELDFVSSYIDIMNYQLDKFHYTIDIPPSLEKQWIPRLLVQPVVENAIVHGLESKPEGGGIRIIGSEEHDWCSLSVEDDGIGMPEAERNALNARLKESDAGGDSFGLWNVSQRLRYQFGEQSGVTVEASPSGGLKVVLRWRKMQS